MGNRRIKAMFLLFALLLSLPFAGCSRKTEKEQIFNKTIHDFDGHLVVNMDEQEDTNFAVYAAETKQIVADGKDNQILSVDEDDCVYTFANPTDDLKNLRPGQVFFVEASRKNPAGAAGKVKELRTDGENLVVCCEPVAMADLFTYVDINMNMDLTQAYFDSSGMGEGAQLEIVPLESRSGNGSAGIVPLSESFNWSGSKGVGISGKYATEIIMGRSNGGKGAAGRFKTENALTIVAVRAQLYYDADSGYFSMDVSLDQEQSTVNSVDFEGSWSNGRGGMGHTWPGISFFFPGTPIAVGIEEYLLISLSGGMKGSFEQGSASTIGITDQIRDLRDFSPESYYRENGKYTNVKLELEGTMEILFGVRANVGVPFVVDLFLEGGIGGRAKGSLAMIERQSDALTADSIHDCDKCLDGDVELVCQSNWGVDARLLSTITGYDLVYRETLAENTVKIGDFYASYREGAENGVECGFGECPHLRWRCPVTVIQEDGKPAEYAYVNSSYPDGREDKRMTDEKGVAVFYLPNGSNALKCSFEGQHGNANVAVNGCPTTASIKLAEKQDIFIVYHLTDSNWNSKTTFDYPELESILRAQYPDAVFVPITQWGTVVQQAQAASMIPQGSDATYSVSPGDIVIQIHASPWTHADAAGYQNLEIQVGAFLLPDKKESSDDETTEATEATEAPVADTSTLIYVYKNGYSTATKHKTTSQGTIGSYFYHYTEELWQGLQFDSNYRIQERGSHWENIGEWYDPAGSWDAHEFDVSAAHQPILVNYVSRAFPFVEMLMAGEWDVNADSSTQP